MGVSTRCTVLIGFLLEKSEVVTPAAPAVRCGHRNPAGKKFCGECGARVTRTEPSAKFYDGETLGQDCVVARYGSSGNELYAAGLSTNSNWYDGDGDGEGDSSISLPLGQHDLDELKSRRVAILNKHSVYPDPASFGVHALTYLTY